MQTQFNDHGGFMSQGSSGDNLLRTHNGSGGGGGGGVTTTTDYSIRPVTIRQLLELTTFTSLPSQTSRIMLDDHELGYVTFVGFVRKASAREANVQYLIEDSTGTMEVVLKYVNSSDGHQMPYEAVEEGTLVRVYGRYRETKVVWAHSVKSCKSPNAVTLHFLQVMDVHRQLTGKAGGLYGMSNASSMSTMPPIRTGDAFGAHSNAGNGDTSMSFTNGTRSEAATVLLGLLRSKKGHFLTTQELSTLMERKGFQMPVTRQALQTLNGDGEIYNGISDEHWAAV